MTTLRPHAWLVIGHRGDESVHVQRAPAELYAARQHGTIEALVLMSDALAAIEAALATLVAMQAALAALLASSADRRAP